MRRSLGVSRCVWSLLWLAALPLLASAQAPGVEERLSKVEGAAASAQSAGDNAWMLVCAAFVLMMTGPGLDRKSRRLNSSHDQRSYAVFCLKKKAQVHSPDASRM